MRILILAIVVFSLGFLALMAYAVRTIFMDFGMIMGALATLCIVAWCILIGHLVDRGSVIVLPPERPNTRTRRGQR